jgi:hypothetical protein
MALQRSGRAGSISKGSALIDSRAVCGRQTDRQCCGQGPVGGQRSPILCQCASRGGVLELYLLAEISVTCKVETHSLWRLVVLAPGVPPPRLDDSDVPASGCAPITGPKHAAKTASPTVRISKLQTFPCFGVPLITAK